jgi:transcription antitermination factor NusG
MKLTERKDHISPTEKRWFAVYTRYRAEKYVCDKLSKKGIENYVPLLKYTRVYTRKKKQVELPLISCYVFVNITKEDYIKVLQTENVINFLKIRGAMISIPQKEIDIMRWVVGEELVEKAHNSPLEKGMKVEIVSGNLTGIKGIVIKRKSKKYVQIALDSLGYTLDLNISEDMLQKVHSLV